MKTLFTSFLAVSLSTSIVICMVFAFRLLLKKAPKSLICLLWALAVLRLLIPVQIESPVSLQPDIPVISAHDTQFFTEPEPVSMDLIPDFIPHEEISNSMGVKTVIVDQVMIAVLVWLAGVVIMLTYTLVTYIKLRRSVVYATKVNNNVFECTELETAFVLGCLRPRIYLPSGLTSQNTAAIVQHECAHIKRGDHLLKLAAFIALAMHWYNPFVWIAYVLLCRDVEDACDEKVIQNLDEQGRKDYSTALLLCSRQRKSVAGCPVAFGEISIKRRICKVLNYRKPAFWISSMAVVFIVLIAALFMTDPFEERHPPYYNELTQMLGTPMDEVLQGLGLSREDLVTDGSSQNGLTSLQVEWQGVKFNLCLFDNGFGGDELAYFSYLATYDDLDQAAEDTVKLSRYFWKQYGVGYQNTSSQEKPELLAHVTAEEVRDMFVNPRRAHIGVSSLSDTWYITSQGGAAKRYVDEYEKSPMWQLLYGTEGQFGNESATPQWTLRFSAWSDESSGQDTTKAYIAITYKVSVKRGSTGGVIIYK